MMETALIIALTFVCAYTLVDEVYAVPTHATTEEAAKDSKETATTASKDLKDVMKAGKEAKKNKKDCVRDCGTDYDPICVHDPADANFKPRTFGSSCALEVHNCQMGTKLAMKSKGECPGAGGTRLS